MEKKVAAFLCLLGLVAQASAFGDGITCVVYFTRVGCPHCAVTDPTVLGELPIERYGSFAVIEYELSEYPANAQVFRRYLEKTGSRQGVPQIVYGGGEAVVGDTPVLNSLKDAKEGGSPCFLLDGPESLREIDFSALSGNPKIWFKDRVLVREDVSDRSRDALVRALIFSDDPASFGGALTEVTPVPAPLSGSEVAFTHALRGGGWLLQWGGASSSSPGDRVRYTSASAYLLTHTGTYMKVLFAIVVVVYLYVLLKKRVGRKSEPAEPVV